MNMDKNRRFHLLLKYIFLFWFGGSFYVTLEVLFRQRSHLAMLILAGLVFIAIGLLNEFWTWETGFLQQVAIGTAIATVGEFITGYIVNLWLGLNVWSYEDLPLNFMGQVCPQFILLWIPIVAFAIIVDDIIRWKFFNEEQPHYYWW